MTAKMEAAESTVEELLREAEASLMFIVKRPGQVFVRGEGSYLWDGAGKRYLDFLQGWAVNSLGHCPPALVEALRYQAGELINGSPALLNRPMIELAALLTGNSCLDKVFFANSGAEANEGALKLARKYGALRRGGAHEVITTWNSFHGRTLAMMSASGKKQWDGLFEPKVPGFIRVDFNDLEAVKQAVTESTCAVMVEPIQGEGGVHLADEAYLTGLRVFCDETGVLLILDEVQTGVGRAGSLFAYEHYGIEPDIMTLGKGLGGGFPLSALLAKEKFCLFEQGDQGGTYCGQPLAMAAGLAVLKEVLAHDLPARAMERGNYLMDKLRAIEEEFSLSNIRGRGVLVGVDLPRGNGAHIVQNCFGRGLLINSPAPNTLRFLPALTVSEAEIDEMVEILTAVLREAL